MIPPDAQRAIAKRAGATVAETPGSHAIYVSNPAAVAAVVERRSRRSTSRGHRDRAGRTQTGPVAVCHTLQR